MSIVYSPLKVFGFPDHLPSRSAGAFPAPVHVRIKPINACNQSCWYCAYRAENLALGDAMHVRDRIPREKMFEIVYDLITMGVRAVTFSGGGEPLIYPDLPETVRRLSAGGIKIGSLTNGAALRGEVADVLAEHATWVRISIDAWDGPSYAKSRRVRPDAFEAVLQNVEHFAGIAERCSLGFSFIVTRENAEHIFEFCSLAKSIGAAHIKLSACVVANGAAENDAYHAPIAPLVTAEIERCRHLEDEMFSVEDHYHALTERFDRPYRTCPMLEFLTVIGADCSVYTCQDKAYTASGMLGSIQDRSFQAFWFSDENAARIRTLDPSASCLHHCTAHAKNILLNQFRSLDNDHAAFV
jgi:MoaA/NifB/PqqE/SkfB family radical SAM enzyme